MAYADLMRTSSRALCEVPYAGCYADRPLFDKMLGKKPYAVLCDVTLLQEKSYARLLCIFNRSHFGSSPH